jgi:hypothetical protein
LIFVDKKDRGIFREAKKKIQHMKKNEPVSKHYSFLFLGRFSFKIHQACVANIPMDRKQQLIV